MDADRWRRIESLYAAAQARTPEERAAFLAEACAGDDALRREVESLLKQGESVASLFEGGAAAAALAIINEGGIDLTGSTIGRFIIHERLGAGGMGEVYRAEDTQLKRTVAIKRLIHNVQHQNPATRLLKEAQRASALNHPRIASVYDVFTVGSELLLVMEYIDGITLRDRMLRPISVPDFCPIAIQCCEALSAAHENGILHGDLKPANIMLTRDGDVKVCDFGLARRLPQGESAGDMTTTAHRGIVGTPGYLPPEVVLEQFVDGRADIFSLGVVFYEMLAGRNPFVGDSLIATLDRVLNMVPEPLDRANSRVPAALARVVHKMLEKDPRRRYAKAEVIGEAFSTIAAGYSRQEHRRDVVARARVWAVLGLATTFIALTVPQAAVAPSAGAAVPLPSEINLVVLPFTVTGAGDDRQHFTEGLTESLNEQLSRLTLNRDFQVATATDRRARNVTNAIEAREQLGATIAVAGSLQYAGDVVRVTSLLVNTRSGRQLRTEMFTSDVSNAVAVQGRVLEAVVRMMGIELDPRERRLLNVNTTSQPGAHDFYLQARGYLLNYDRAESIDSAIAVFRKALEVDPRYALAYAGLGQAYWRKHELTGSASWAEPARGACEGALAIDATLAEPHACLGMVLNGTGEYERAATSYSLALDREPTNDVASIGLATAYERLGRHADAEETYRRAIGLRPHYWAGYNNLGTYYYRFGRYEEALEMLQQAVALAPDSFRGYSSVGVVEFVMDRNGEAIQSFKRSLSIRPNYAAASNLATLYYFEGEFQLAADLFRQALSLEKGSYQVWGNLAQTLERIGAREEAAAAFRQARTLALERLDVNPRNAAFHVAVAEFSAALGDTDQAARALENALKLAPEDAHTLLQIGVYYESRLKRRDEALKWLAQAVARGLSWREIERTPDLRQLREDPRFQQLRRTR